MIWLINDLFVSVGSFLSLHDLISIERVCKNWKVQSIHLNQRLWFFPFYQMQHKTKNSTLNSDSLIKPHVVEIQELLYVLHSFTMNYCLQYKALSFLYLKATNWNVQMKSSDWNRVLPQVYQALSTNWNSTSLTYSFFHLNWEFEANSEMYDDETDQVIARSHWRSEFQVGNNLNLVFEYHRKADKTFLSMNFTSRDSSWDQLLGTYQLIFYHTESHAWIQTEKQKFKIALIDHNSSDNGITKHTLREFQKSELFQCFTPEPLCGVLLFSLERIKEGSG